MVHDLIFAAMAYQSFFSWPGCAGRVREQGAVLREGVRGEGRLAGSGMQGGQRLIEHDMP